jgi:hypothetical protein
MVVTGKVAISNGRLNGRHQGNVKRCEAATLFLPELDDHRRL